MKKILFLTFFLLLTHTVEARIYIRIDEVSEKKFPIALTDLVNVGQKRDKYDWSRDVPKILHDDLRLTGG